MAFKVAKSGWQKSSARRYEVVMRLSSSREGLLLVRLHFWSWWAYWRICGCVLERIDLVICLVQDW